MPSDIGIIHAHEFIRATPVGELDFEQTKELPVQFAPRAPPGHNSEIFLDTRTAPSQMAEPDLWHLAAVPSRLRQALSRKTAVPCPSARFDHAVFLALCAPNRGLKIRPFTSFEDAIGGADCGRTGYPPTAGADGNQGRSLRSARCVEGNPQEGGGSPGIEASAR